MKQKKNSYISQKKDKTRLWERVRNWWYNSDIKFLFDFFFEPQQKQMAGTLTFYTMTGIIPFCAMQIWANHIFYNNTFSATFRNAIDKLIPNFHETFQRIYGFANTSMDGMASKWKYMWIAIILILISVIGMFDNIQKIFNRIWSSRERIWYARWGVMLLTAFCSILAIYLCASLASKIESVVFILFCIFLILFICISAAFYHLPFDKKPQFKATTITASITSLFLIGWIAAIPVASKYIATFQTDGLLVFLLMFWVDIAWFMAISGAKLCRLINSNMIEHSSLADKKNVWKDMREMSPINFCYLAMLVTSVVFNDYLDKEKKKCAGTASEDNDGLTFKEIRERVSYIENEECPARMSMTLLNQIMQYLCHQDSRLPYHSAGILKIRHDSMGKVTYFTNIPTFEISTFSVGDFLKLYYLKGKMMPGYSVPSELEQNISKHMEKYFGNISKPIIELTPDMFIEKTGKSRHGWILKKKFFHL